jgi:hypothetical protein
MEQAFSLQFHFATYEPRALPWAGMNQAFGVSLLGSFPRLGGRFRIPVQAFRPDGKFLLAYSSIFCSSEDWPDS